MIAEPAEDIIIKVENWRREFFSKILESKPCVFALLLLGYY